MEKILITGVGGGVGQSIIKALQNTTYELVGVDSEKLAVGLHCLPSSYLGYYASDPNYIDRLLEICQYEECSLIFPGHDAELGAISENAENFISNNITPVVSSFDVIRICDDKMETNIFIRNQRLPAPETFLFNERNNNHRFPVVLKPQKGGARSRNMFVARTQNEFDTYKSLVDPDNCIIQEYIDGDEYTCGSVTLGGKCKGVIIMRRILRNGDTYKAFVEKNELIETTVRDVIEKLKPFGACNVQLRMRNGIPYIFEINARCSGTTAARALAGFNEPKIIADYVLHGIEPDYSIKNISVLRYWKELVIENKNIDDLDKMKHITTTPLPL